MPSSSLSSLSSLSSSICFDCLFFSVCVLFLWSILKGHFWQNIPSRLLLGSCSCRLSRLVSWFFFSGWNLEKALLRWTHVVWSCVGKSIERMSLRFWRDSGTHLCGLFLYTWFFDTFRTCLCFCFCCCCFPLILLCFPSLTPRLNLVFRCFTVFFQLCVVLRNPSKSVAWERLSFSSPPFLLGRLTWTDFQTYTAVMFFSPTTIRFIYWMLFVRSETKFSCVPIFIATWFYSTRISSRVRAYKENSGWIWAAYEGIRAWISFVWGWRSA